MAIELRWLICMDEHGLRSEPELEFREFRPSKHEEDDEWKGIPTVIERYKRGENH